MANSEHQASVLLNGNATNDASGISFSYSGWCPEGGCSGGGSLNSLEFEAHQTELLRRFADIQGKIENNLTQINLTYERTQSVSLSIGTGASEKLDGIKDVKDALITLNSVVASIQANVASVGQEVNWLKNTLGSLSSSQIEWFNDYAGLRDEARTKFTSILAVAQAAGNVANGNATKLQTQAETLKEIKTGVAQTAQTVARSVVGCCRAMLAPLYSLFDFKSSQLARCDVQRTDDDEVTVAISGDCNGVEHNITGEYCTVTSYQPARYGRFTAESNDDVVFFYSDELRDVVAIPYRNGNAVYPPASAGRGR